MAYSKKQYEIDLAVMEKASRKNAEEFKRNGWSNKREQEASKADLRAIKAEQARLAKGK